MNKDIMKGKWKEIKGQVKQQWGKLTDDELTQVEGNYDELCGLIQKRYGYEKDRAAKELDEFISKSDETTY